MTRYFKIVEVDRGTFIEKTGGDLDCKRASFSADDGVYAAVDDEQRSLEAELFLFDDVVSMY